MLMAQAFPRSRFIGIDLSQEALKKAQSEAKQQRIRNVDFIMLDAASLEENKEWKESVDYVTAFDAIHDQTRPLEALRRRLPYPDSQRHFFDGRHCRRIKLVGQSRSSLGTVFIHGQSDALLAGGLVNGGTGLGMMWGREKAVDMLMQAGFREVEVLEIPDDPFNFHFFGRK